MTRAVVFRVSRRRRALPAKCCWRRRHRSPAGVTHQDNPAENIWFASVADWRADHAIPDAVAGRPEPARTSPERIAASVPTSCSRSTIATCWAQRCWHAATRGALNMHGSLLPKYRGRVPVNWAVIHGEQRNRCHAALHGGKARCRRYRRSASGADPARRYRARRIPQGHASPRRWCFTAVCRRWLPATRRVIPQDLGKGSYFGGRKPEDGRIDWQSARGGSAQSGACRGTALSGRLYDHRWQTVRLLSTLLQPGRRGPCARPSLYCAADRWYAQCGDARGIADRGVGTGRQHTDGRRNRLDLWNSADRPAVQHPGKCMKKILILGVNGFIGHHLSKRIIGHDGLGSVRHGHADPSVSPICSTTSAFIFSKATSPSTRSGSSTTSASATWCCPWWRSPRRPPTSRSRCGSSNWTSRPTCQSCAPASNTTSALFFPPPRRSMACARTANSIRTIRS